MATVKAPARTTTNKDKRPRMDSSLLNMDNRLLNTANILLPARRNMAIRLNQATSLHLNHLTSNLPTVATKVVTTHSLTTVPTTRPINSIHTIARRSSTALPITATKVLLEATIHRHNINSSSNMAVVTIANSSTLPSRVMDPQVVQATIKITARIPPSHNTATPIPTRTTAAHNTATQLQAHTALPNPAPKTAASWALSPAAPQAVSPGTK